jgi:hypothetical protein
MDLNWTKELTEQLDFHWRRQLVPRLEGLTDEEYLWEPVDGCWSVRPDGEGGFALDWSAEEPVPPPFTTIAWRIAHIGSVVLGARAANHFGDGYDLAAERWPGTAAAGLDFLRDSYARWHEGVSALDEEALARPCGPAEGPYGDLPFAALVLHVNREVIHHGAEVATLRDLYRDRSR